MVDEITVFHDDNVFKRLKGVSVFLKDYVVHLDVVFNEVNCDSMQEWLWEIMNIAEITVRTDNFIDIQRFRSGDLRL